MSNASTHNVIILDELNDYNRINDDVTGQRHYYAGFRSNTIDLDSNLIATTIKTADSLDVIKLNLESGDVSTVLNFDNSDSTDGHSDRHHRQEVTLSKVIIESDSLLATSYESLSIENFNGENSSNDTNYFMSAPIQDGYGNTLILYSDGRLRKVHPDLDKWAIDLKEKIREQHDVDLSNMTFPYTPVVFQKIKAQRLIS